MTIRYSLKIDDISELYDARNNWATRERTREKRRKSEKNRTSFFFGLYSNFFIDNYPLGLASRFPASAANFLIIEHDTPKISNIELSALSKEDRDFDAN